MSRKKALEDYVEVKDRIKLYKSDHPDYRVITDVIGKFKDGDVIMVKATIFKNAEEYEKDIPHATGIAEETRDAGYINKTSHVENCETSAIGRALANADYSGSDKRPSAEEMDKVKRTKKAKEKKPKVSGKEEKERNDEPKDEDVTDKINSFETSDELVEWFNTTINDMSGKERQNYQEKYLPLVRERMEELDG